MKLKDKIDQDFIEAKKKRDELTSQVLTMVRAAIRNAEIAKRGDLDDSEIIDVLNSEVKKRKDAVEQFTKGNRPEQAKGEQAEIEILKKYLPEQLSEADIQAVVDKAVDEVGAESMADMGKVMGKVMPQLKGKADGSAVQKIVRAKLAGN